MDCYLAVGGPVPRGCRALYHLRRFRSGSQNPQIPSRVLRAIQGSKFLQQPGLAVPACSLLLRGALRSAGGGCSAPHSVRLPCPSNGKLRQEQP